MSLLLGLDELEKFDSFSDNELHVGILFGLSDHGGNWRWLRVVFGAGHHGSYWLWLIREYSNLIFSTSDSSEQVAC